MYKWRGKANDLKAVTLDRSNLDINKLVDMLIVMLDTLLVHRREAIIATITATMSISLTMIVQTMFHNA